MMNKEKLIQLLEFQYNLSKNARDSFNKSSEFEYPAYEYFNGQVDAVNDILEDIKRGDYDQEN